MKWLKVNLLIRDKDIPVDAIQRQHSPGEYIALLQHWFLTNAVYFAHIEGFLVELVDDHLIHALLEIIVALLLGVLVQKDYPLLQVLYVLIRRVDG